MNSTLKLGAVIGALSVAAGLAHAADERGGKSFNQLDRNQDSRVSMAEAQSDERMRSAFPNADRNVDGYVSLAEYSTWLNSGGTTTPSDRTVPPDATRPGPQNNPEIDPAR